jgi:hypothetical protein
MRAMQTNPLTEAIRRVGLGRLAAGLGRSGQAVRKWEAAGRLPRTEWTGETTYAEQIERLTGGEITKQALLAKWPAPEQQEAA